MKLWQKVSLICSAVLTSIVLLMGGLLLREAEQSILELTYQQSSDKQRNLLASFSEMSNYYLEETDSAPVEYSLVKYCFSRFADSTCVLMKGGETLYSNVAVDMSRYAIEGYDAEQFEEEIGGRQILITGSNVNVRNECYAVYVVEDITGAYESITRMVWRFALIGGVGILLGFVLIGLLVRRSMQPLAVLKTAAGRIAAGGYGERATVLSKDEVGALANDFNRMAESVENHIGDLIETAERQRLFIGGVTHEFKTPLTTVILNADTLQNACMDEEERQTALSYIERQCKWLERMTQKLLKLITLKQDIELKPSSVPQLFERVEESMAETLRQRDTRLIFECKLNTLSMDADLMQSVLINLVDNASKASAPGQAVTMRAYDDVIEVSDNGIGIPESELARITEPFYVVDKSRSKKLGGSGLGLALVKEIISAHGAELEIDSGVGIGTTIWIQFKR
jgi:signal transduction histidine kinase